QAAPRDGPEVERAGIVRVELEVALRGAGRPLEGRPSVSLAVEAGIAQAGQGMRLIVLRSHRRRPLEQPGRLRELALWKPGVRVVEVALVHPGGQLNRGLELLVGFLVAAAQREREAARRVRL